MEWATSESMAPAKSAFVTVVAWIFIALDGMAGFILLLQNILLSTVVPLDQIREVMARAHSAGRLPPVFASIFEHVRPFLFLLLVFTLIKLAAAIGLLNRRNWGRLLFIGILALGIVWTVVGIVAQQYIVSAMMTMPRPRNAPPDFELIMQGMMNAIRVVSGVFAVGFAVLYAWMIRKLLSPEIVAEFA
jgi:hypothetical protein